MEILVKQAKGLQTKDTYLADGITKTTDPFWTVTCLDCGHASWSILHVKECFKCGSVNITCIPANQVKKSLFS
jgi:hypothetical protein